jgi:cytochrome P450
MASEASVIDTNAALAPLPPGPRGLPLIGSAHRLLGNPIGFMEECVEKYGRIHTIKLGPKTVFILHDAEAIDTMLIRNADNYLKSDLGQDATRPLLGKSVPVLTDVAAWKNGRHYIRPVFVGGVMRDYHEHMVRSLTEDADRLLAESRAGGTTDIYVAVHEMIFRILIGTLFSRGINRDRAAWIAGRFDAMKPYINARFLSLGTLDWLPLPEIRRGKQALAELDAFVYELMETRRQEGILEVDGDILDILLTTTDLEGNRLSDETVRDECMMVLFGGHETTAGSLTWTIGLLADNPEAQQKHLEEIDRVLEGRTPEFADVAKLTYTRQVFEEGMRFFPPWLILFRQAVEDDVLCGYRIPAGSLMAFCGYTNHRDPAHWPDPERFEPERHTKEARLARHRGAWIPFSLGSRACMGVRMANHTGTLLLAILAQRMRLELPGPLPEPQVRLSIRPKGGLPMIVHARP